MRNRLLLTSALCAAAVFTGQAFAQTTIDDRRDTPIRTSTSNNGEPGGIVIGASGRVIITDAPGPAVTVDSDNTVENRGEIRVTGADDAVGVLLQGGNAGELSNIGRITVGGRAADADEDDEDDGRDGVNMVGILIDGDEAFQGDVDNAATGRISVFGHESAAIRTLAELDGALSSRGDISVIGDNSYGIDLRAGVTGDVMLGGATIISGAGSSAVRVGENIGGLFRINGNVSTTAYLFSGRPNEEELEDLTDEDMRQSGAAILIGADVEGGFYVAGANPEQGTSGATIAIRGEAPAVWVTPEARYDGPANIVLGLVTIPVQNEEDEDEEAEEYEFSFVNRGRIGADGVLDGVSATAIRIDGAQAGDTLFTTTLEGGLLNLGTVAAVAFEANATGVLIGNGAIVPVLENRSAITSDAIGSTSSAHAIVFLEGADVGILRNTSVITATSFGGSAYAIQDFSNSLSLIENTSIITARFFEEPEEEEEGHEGEEEAEASAAASSTQSLPPGVTLTAIDVSNSTIDVTYRQFVREGGSETDNISLTGDIRFGSGDDTVDVSAGTLTGDIYFGDGADRLLISGTGAVRGALHTSDNDLSIEVDGGSLEIRNADTARIREARFGDGARLIFRVDAAAAGGPILQASEQIVFEEGSRLSASLSNLIGDGATFIVLQANELVISETLENLSDTNAPYLYATSLVRDENDPDTLVLMMTRRTADQLGMHRNQAAAYDGAWALWEHDAELGSAFAQLSTAQDFFAAFDQLLPEYSASAIQFAIASNDSAIGALSNRLDAARRSPEDTGGIWVQEFAYFADRSAGAFGPGYRGQGFGLAMGIDRPAGPFYAVGLNVVGAASEISESAGFDEPMSALSAQIGAYGGLAFGEWGLDLYGGIGVNRFETERRVLIITDPVIIDRRMTAEWTGYHYAASARFGRDFEMGRWFMRPALSIDYLHMFESSYQETGGGSLNLAISNRESTSFAGTAMLTAGGRFTSGNTWWSPQFRLGVREDFGDIGAITRTSLVTGGAFDPMHAENLPSSSLIFGFGFHAGSDYSTFSFDLDSDVRDGFIRHSARFVVRLVF